MWQVEIIDAGEYTIRDTDAQRWKDLMSVRIDIPVRKDDQPTDNKM